MQSRVEGTHVVPGGVVLGARLDAVGQEAEDGPDPQQDREAPEELAAELDPLGGGGRRRECIRPVPGQDLLGFAVGQTLGAQDSHRTFPEQPWHPSTPRAPRTRPSPAHTQARAPARSPCCTSGRPPPPTSCALSEERGFEGRHVSVGPRAGVGPVWDPVQCQGQAYHGHLLLEVLHVPALLGGLALLGRALVIFLVLRGGDTIAVRATRLRARRGYGGTCPPSLSPLPCVSQPVSLGGIPSGSGCLSNL